MDTILQGAVLLVVGMTIVYLFLCVLVVVCDKTANLVNRFNHILPDDEPKKKPRPVVSTPASDPLIAVAIAGAMARSN